MKDATKTPPQLGDVEIQRVNGREWRLQRNGETVAGSLSFAQVLAIIRGEMAIDGLRKEALEDGDF